MHRRLLLQSGLSVVALSLFPMELLAAGLSSPKRGDPMRKELLDTIRVRVETDLKQRVKFVVSTINVMGEWAYLAVDPVSMNGKAIDIRKTKYADDADMMDGLMTFSLLRHKNGRWNEISFFTGPTDVSQLAWIDEYGISKALLGFE